MGKNVLGPAHHVAYQLHWDVSLLHESTKNFRGKEDVI